MNQQAKKKLCWNCEGSVATTLETCPFCGVYLNPTGADTNQMASTVFGSKSDRENIPKPPYVPEEETDAVEEVLQQENKSRSGLQSVYALLLILAGSVYGFFGLVIFFFSRGGQLTLSWSFEWSYVFLALSLPLLGVGLLQSRDLD
jgi:hypothetical protein